MPVIESTNTIAGAFGKMYRNAGAPVNGTNEVQTLTFGGTPTGGTFQLSLLGFTTAAIAWSATNATLLANIQAALNALVPIGAGQTVVTAGSLTAGIGTVLVTFSGANFAVSNIGAAFGVINNLTGTSPTLAATRSTPGVSATHRNALTGDTVTDTTNGIEYQNQSATLGQPSWVKLGLES